jgi:hypothetical protein
VLDPVGTIDPAEPLWEDGGYCPRLQPAWRHDVALEIWVDADQDPVRIRLAGELNERTSGNLFGVVEELLSSGARNFQVLTSPHMSEADTSDVIDDLQCLVRGRVGQDREAYFTWNRPCSDNERLEGMKIAP